MCGIIGYIGNKQAYGLLLNGLKKLEYRGYDSAGIAIIENSKINLHKVVGRVKNLEEKDLKGTIGIGHTRWATHGKPSMDNAHPHIDCEGKIVVAHNGIIENFLALKNKLKSHKFRSETDSEVLAHLIEENYKGDLKQALLKTVSQLEGTYAICAIHAEKEEIVAVRKGSPLVLGLGDGENIVASDVSAIVEHTDRVIYLEDNEMALVKINSVDVFDLDGNPLDKKECKIDWDMTSAEKQGYKHYMLKEIHEQPEVVENTLQTQIECNVKAEKIHIVACGTAWHAALVGKYIIETIAGIPVDVDVASEFRYRNPLIEKDDLFIVVSQSGETADTLAALRLAKEKEARTLGIVNVIESTIAREADDVIYTRAGPEIGVASTKAFISQLVVMYLIAQKISGKTIEGLKEIPELIKKILDENNSEAIAKKYFKVFNFIFIGRNINYPIALEGALKLKEISYIHAEGYASGEMKHGPIALVTDKVPTVAIAVKDSVYPKMISNVEEVKAREGKIITVATEGDKDIKQCSDEVIYIPKVDEILYPLLTVIPLQLLAYHIADMRDLDVDKPRNLAKSVTVE